MGNEAKADVTLKQPAEFESAIKASGFGRFNILLLCVSFPALISSVMETAVISYVLSSAECDLNLNLVNKGILNAITYVGMIVSAVGWGYLSDSKGRKNVLVWGYLLHFLSVIGASISQSVVHLMIAKFFCGFIMCGPFSVLFTYLTEFHGQKYRSIVMMIVGVMYSAASLLLPLFAILILPQEWNFSIFSMKFSAWKVYLAVCGVPSLFGGIFLSFFPESPRFLMSHGRNAEALEIFKTIYSINTRKCRDSYPISQLVEEVHQKFAKNSNLANLTTLEDALKPMKYDIFDESKPRKAANPLKTLFTKPYLSLALQVYLLNFCVVLGTNTMRLWLPQLFSSLYEYEQTSMDKGSSSMCKILEYSVNKTEIIQNPDDECKVVITSSTYMNNLIVGSVVMFGFLVAGSLIKLLGDKWIQVLSLSISGTCGFALYWSSSVTTTLVITSIYSCMGGIATTSCISTSANLFPTSSRSMIVTLSMSFGRIGTIVGNVFFPILMSFGCIPPIVMITAIMYVASVLALSLPSTKKAELK